MQYNIEEFASTGNLLQLIGQVFSLLKLMEEKKLIAGLLKKYYIKHKINK